MKVQKLGFICFGPDTISLEISQHPLQSFKIVKNKCRTRRNRQHRNKTPRTAGFFSGSAFTRRRLLCCTGLDLICLVYGVCSEEFPSLLCPFCSVDLCSTFRSLCKIATTREMSAPGEKFVLRNTDLLLPQCWPLAFSHNDCLLISYSLLLQNSDGLPTTHPYCQIFCCSHPLARKHRLLSTTFK